MKSLFKLLPLLLIILVTFSSCGDKKRYDYKIHVTYTNGTSGVVKYTTDHSSYIRLDESCVVVSSVDIECGVRKINSINFNSVVIEESKDFENFVTFLTWCLGIFFIYILVKVYNNRAYFYKAKKAKERQDRCLDDLHKYINGDLDTFNMDNY